MPNETDYRKRRKSGGANRPPPYPNILKKVSHVVHVPVVVGITAVTLVLELLVTAVVGLLNEKYPKEWTEK